MFNAPRPAQRYGTTPVNGLGGSFVDDNPLTVSIFDDPWSAAPSPSPPPINTATSVFSSVIGRKKVNTFMSRAHVMILADAAVPETYNRAFTALDSTNSGEVSVSALSRVLATCSLPAATVDRVLF
jgi:sorting nexin-8